jgi:hypothetical protein
LPQSCPSFAAFPAHLKREYADGGAIFGFLPKVVPECITHPPALGQKNARLLARALFIFNDLKV